MYLKRLFELAGAQDAVVCRPATAGIGGGSQRHRTVSCDPGDIICDEHERSDCMYIVRQGLVKIVKSISHMVSVQDVTTWVSLARASSKARTVPGTPAGKLWTMLSDKAASSCACRNWTRLEGRTGPNCSTPQ